ncbi:MLO-like protein 6 [Zingiber officinale]|uniref:MLO-like protein 6 n=1 Tax=Zingiber officinale TaxID=94328 RepID=UPI001C4C6AF8|nr:MLO-like protein 6 [Zingiber officinale]
MAAGGGGEGSRSMEETPTWAVAVVCLVIVVISVLIEHAIHLLGKWLQKHHKKALYEALEKIKAELMLMGFISFLLTVLQSSISKICVPLSVGDSWHPCKPSEEDDIAGHLEDPDQNPGGRRRLLQTAGSVRAFRRVLAAGGSSDTCPEGKVALISGEAINQLHIFIFVLAVSHVLYCVCTLAFGRLKMRRWKGWEMETRTAEYQFTHDPDRFRFARDTSFGRRHLNFWSKSPLLIWIVCFFRQFVSSVSKVDYLTLRHGFIMAHLAPQSSSKFNFQKYIKRSLEEDFTVVVGISPAIWFMAVVFLLFNTHGWQSYLWQPFIPLIIILMVGTKLQVIITKMAIQIMERGDVVKGVPVVQPRDNLFWFNRPGLLLFLIHFVLFQNAFQLAFFAWSWYEFGYPSCFHKRIEDIIIRISMGILIQVLCSYVILPLYALVTQMGTNLKPTIFSERVATALRKWHHTARKNVKESRKSGSVTPYTSRPNTPSHSLSPVHLLQYYHNEVDYSSHNSPQKYFVEEDQFDPEGMPSPSGHTNDESFSQYRNATLKRFVEANIEMREVDDDGRLQLPIRQGSDGHANSRVSIDFSFDKMEKGKTQV